MARPGILAGLLVAGGVVSLAAVLFVAETGPGHPEATGEVGVLLVFAQTPKGPVRLPPGRLIGWPRPQDLAFQLSMNGTGPRWLRIEVERGSKTTVVYEERFEAPVELESLQYVLRLDESDPDLVTVIVTIEAPHSLDAISIFPIKLVGGNTRFWDVAPDAGAQD